MTGPIFVDFRAARREEIAAKAMQGILTTCTVLPISDLASPVRVAQITRASVAYADALIAALEETA